MISTVTVIAAKIPVITNMPSQDRAKTYHVRGEERKRIDGEIFMFADRWREGTLAEKYHIGETEIRYPSIVQAASRHRIRRPGQV